MQLTRFSDYALRILLYAHAAAPRLVTIEEMAEAYRVSRSHLMKVVSALSRSGHLTAVRGRTGGVTLARPAEEIRLGEVLRATEPDFALVECFATRNSCVIDGCCRLPTALRSALAAFLSELDRYTLADVALRPRHFKLIAPTKR